MGHQPPSCVAAPAQPTRNAPVVQHGAGCARVVAAEHVGPRQAWAAAPKAPLPPVRNAAGGVPASEGTGASARSLGAGSSRGDTRSQRGRECLCDYRNDLWKLHSPRRTCNAHKNRTLLSHTLSSTTRTFVKCSNSSSVGQSLWEALYFSAAATTSSEICKPTATQVYKRRTTNKRQ